MGFIIVIIIWLTIVYFFIVKPIKKYIKYKKEILETNKQILEELKRDKN